MLLPPRRRPLTRVDPYWLANGLAAVFDLTIGRELLTGAQASANTTSRQGSSLPGLSADFSGTANVQFAHRAQYAITGPLTVFVHCDIDALTNYGALIAKQVGTTTSAPYEIRVGSSSATDGRLGLLRAGAGSGAGNYSFVDSGAAAVTAGQSVRIFATHSTSTIIGTTALWVNGRKYAGVELSAPVDTPVTDGSADVWIGRRFDGATQLDGRIHLVALFRGVLSDDDIIALSADPRQLARRTRRILMAPPVEGGTVFNPLSGRGGAAARPLAC